MRQTKWKVEEQYQQSTISMDNGTLLLTIRYWKNLKEGVIRTGRGALIRDIRNTTTTELCSEATTMLQNKTFKQLQKLFGYNGQHIGGLLTKAFMGEVNAFLLLRIPLESFNLHIGAKVRRAGTDITFSPECGVVVAHLQKELTDPVAVCFSNEHTAHNPNNLELV